MTSPLAMPTEIDLGSVVPVELGMFTVVMVPPLAVEALPSMVVLMPLFCRFGYQ